MNSVEVIGFAHGAAWLPWAVQYFFLIGLSTAAFFLSLPGLVWHRPAWKRVSERALLAALVCSFVAPVALLAALISLQGAWATRWVLLMSGQSLPKIGATGHAYVWTLTPDSLLGVIGTFGLCLTLSLVFTRLIPWNESEHA